MPKKIKSRKTIRLKNYDYSQEGYYFITICSKNMECFFGTIINKVMQKSNLGDIVNNCWQEIPNHFPNVILHQFVVMPNHIHGIIELKSIKNNMDSSNNVDSQKTNDIPPINMFQKIIPRSIGSIIRSFKSAVTKISRDKKILHTVWQRNFYEHIIRNEKSFINISIYIKNNPEKWDLDRFKQE